jgi:DNA-binding MurR/RpiR family transcriptional regulator
VGVPEFEPWHFAAHLGEQAALCGRMDLVPTLLRWRIPREAPPHPAVAVDALISASRNQTVLVINPIGEVPELLERVADARHRGARIMTLHRGNPDLIELSHETLLVDPFRPDRDFEMTQHLVTDLTPNPANGELSQ